MNPSCCAARSIRDHPQLFLREPFHRIRDAHPHQVHTPGRARLSRSQPCAAGPLLQALCPRPAALQADLRCCPALTAGFQPGPLLAATRICAQTASPDSPGGRGMSFVSEDDIHSQTLERRAPRHQAPVEGNAETSTSRPCSTVVRVGLRPWAVFWARRASDNLLWP